MKLRVTRHQVWIGSRQYRVVRPRPLPLHATLRDAQTCFHLRLDQATAWQFAGLWELAARSPSSIVHLPLRGNALDTESGWQAEMPALDLVLVHHSLQLRPSAWPQIRRSLGAGRPQTVDLPDEALRTRLDQEYPQLRYRENRDRFVHHLHAGTLFLTGSAAVFGLVVAEFGDVAGHPSAHPKTSPWEYCAEFDVVDKPRWPVDVTEMFIGHTENWPAPSTTTSPSPG
ncbi:hypothetical protein AB0K15_13120 [Amycolatopsis sp. NPDC049253]|uniref:hypothetical protein n=1 Tax=Amycolatopsis sp. NPDC049253 TaxID=3155274 RepID=UPI00342FB481